MIAGPDFVVLTGFLGSGKTTLLRDFLASPAAADTAVIVNEVGEIGLDGAILRESAGGEVAMALLSNGCVCCSMGSDLARTVGTVLQAERPDGRPLRRIVLETSGLSRPGPVLRQLAELASYGLRVWIVATYDAEHGGDMERFAEAAAQWAAAETIVLTKLDRATRGLAASAEAASRLNPLARIVAIPERCDAVRQAFARPASPMPVSRLATFSAPISPNLLTSTLLARLPSVVGYAELAAWLDNLAGLLGERLLRLKGLVRVAECERPLLIQSVGTLFSAPRQFGGGEEGSFLVVIGRDLRADEVLSVTPDLGVKLSGATGRGLVAEAV